MFDGGAGPEATRRIAERSVGAALGRYGGTQFKGLSC